MNGLNALIRRTRYKTDDYGRNCLVVKRLHVTGNELLLGRFSYDLVVKERKAEGLKTPAWEFLPTVYFDGVYV
jgi:hypothetical protein